MESASNLTVLKLKKWLKGAQALKMDVHVKRLWAAHERSRVDAYILPLFRSFGFEVKCVDDLYLAKDEAKVEAFYAACDKAHRENGFTGPAGHCPALVAEESARKAENALLASFDTFCGVDTTWRSLKERKRALDLAMRIERALVQDACDMITRWPMMSTVWKR